MVDIITIPGVVGRCYSQVADGKATGQCLNFNSEVLCNNSPHPGFHTISLFLLTIRIKNGISSLEKD